MNDAYLMLLPMALSLLIGGIVAGVWLHKNYTDYLEYCKTRDTDSAIKMLNVVFEYLGVFGKEKKTDE